MKKQFISPQEIKERRSLNAISRDMSMMTKMLLTQTKMLQLAIHELNFLAEFGAISLSTQAHIRDCLQRIKEMAD